jgi:hypothetical protein
MRAILTPDIAPGMGVVLFKPGTEIMGLFRQGRVLIENVPERLQALPSGLVPAVAQPLASDPILTPFLINEKVISAAGGLASLEYHLELIGGPCQWPLDKYHHHDFTFLRYPPGAIRLCWSCDNELRLQTTTQLEALAVRNVSEWIIFQARRELGFDESHVVTLPELCFWAISRDLAGVLPEGMARKALRMPEEVIGGVMKEIDLTPPVSAAEIVQEKAKAAGAAIKCRSIETTQAVLEQQPKVLALRVDPESPESFMLRPKRRRWTSEQYTRWVKAQPCEGCRRPADDPHHVIGYGMGGTATKAHDLFVIPLCRECHDKLHADVAEFEKKHGTQLELLFRFLDRVLAIGVIVKA